MQVPSLTKKNASAVDLPTFQHLDFSANWAQSPPVNNFVFRNFPSLPSLLLGGFPELTHCACFFLFLLPICFQPGPECRRALWWWRRPLFGWQRPPSPPTLWCHSQPLSVFPLKI